MKNKRPCRIGFFSEKEQKEMLNEGNLSLFIENDLEYTYNISYMPDHKWAIEKMLNDAYEAGSKSTSNDIKEILGIK